MMNEQLLHKNIEKLEKGYIRFLKELIRTPSVTGKEQAGQKMVKKVMKGLGIFDKEVYPKKIRPYTKTSREYVERPCIVGKIKGRSNSNFILNAHIDTAPVEDALSWDYPPFSAALDGGKLFGRGALDDKPGIAMMLLIAESFLKSDIAFPGSIYFESVIEDEDTGNGTRACTLQGYRADAAIVIDGTWPFRIIDSHLGQLSVTCAVQGVPAAACSHARGTNPIDISCAIIKEIHIVIDQKNKKIRKWLSIEKPFFVNVGAIKSGVWAGSVPESCVFESQVGFPLPFTPDQIYKEIAGIVNKFKADHKVAIMLSKGNLAIKGFSNPSNKMVGIMKQTVERLLGNEMPVLNKPVTGHCDLRNILNCNGRPAAAILYGPGGGGNPHIKNEYYLVEHFVPVAKNIASSILKWYKLI